MYFIEWNARCLNGCLFPKLTILSNPCHFIRVYHCGGLSECASSLFFFMLTYMKIIWYFRQLTFIQLELVSLQHKHTYMYIFQIGQYGPNSLKLISINLFFSSLFLVRQHFCWTVSWLFLPFDIMLFRRKQRQPTEDIRNFFPFWLSCFWCYYSMNYILFYMEYIFYATYASVNK